MKMKMWAFLGGLVAIVGVLAAFATGDADGASDDPADNVFLGELDLAEQMEIWRNQYRRMTPGNEPLVQDVGTWPAAWEEFGTAWNMAPAERDLATWLVPVTAEREGGATVLRNGYGVELWRGTTDFAKEKSANVTLSGTLIAEEDWPLWEAARLEIAKRLQGPSTPRLRDGAGGGSGGGDNGPKMFVSASASFTNSPPEFRVGLQWTNDITLDLFAFGPLHVQVTNSVTYTNDENQVIVTNLVSWHSVEPGLTGRYDNLWDYVGTVALTNGEEAVFVDTNFVPERAVVRFYAAFALGDADNDGLNDAFETAILGTATNSADSDNDGLGDWNEYYVHRTDPGDKDSDHDWIDDPTELSIGLNPTKPDSDGDGSWDGSDPSPTVSNVWWVVETTTNEWIGYGLHYVGDEPLWPPEPVWTNQLIVTGTCSRTDAIPGRVSLWGLVDDAITVDGNQIEGTWTNGAKIFTNLDVTPSITNLASKTFRIDLFDWPDLPNGGPNEVRLGREDYPFRAVWEWWVPIEIYMEPIWANPSYPLENPSGILLGSNGWFTVSLEPSDVVPANKIVWTSDFNKVSFPGTGRGLWVESQPVSAGNDAVRVMVEDAIGDFDLPPFHVRVAAANVVTAKVGVVTKNGVPATTSNNIVQAVSFANRVLSQTGKQIEVLWPIVEIPAEDGFWDVHCSSNQLYSLLAKIPAFGGLKVYFTHSIAMPNGLPGAGVNYSSGMLLSSTAVAEKGRIWAHEFCHACGLRDIFLSHSETALTTSGNIRETWMPDDWGYYGKNGTNELPLVDIVTRLLMFGQPEHDDIPTGRVHGLWYSVEGGNKVWHVTNAPVGLSGMTNTPAHQ